MHSIKFSPISATTNARDKNSTSHTREKRSLVNAFLQALKLICFDLLLGCTACCVVIAISILFQYFPTNSFCELLRTEANSDVQYSLPYATILLEIGWNGIFYTIPLVTFLILTEKTSSHSWTESLCIVIRRWRKVINSFWLCVAIASVYRLCLFFIYPFQDKFPVYPWWYSIPLSLIWFFSALYVINVSANVWTAKQSTHFVIDQQFSQSVIQSQTNKVFKSLRSRLIMSVIFPAIHALLLARLVENVFHVRNEMDRTLLILVAIIPSYPLWMILDHQGRKSLPWPQEIQNASNLIESRSLRHNITSTSYVDPVLQNGFVFSIFLLTGIILLVRILQANMDNLLSKIGAGILSSALESLFVVMEPHISSRARNATKSFTKALSTRVKIAPISPIALNSRSISTLSDRSRQKYKDKKIYKWHRAHIVVIVNRLEVFSIMFSHGLMIFSSTHRQVGYMNGRNNVSESDAVCDKGDVIEFITSMFVLCMLEVLIECATYTYLLKIEHLEIEKATNRPRFKVAFFYFSIIAAMYSLNVYFPIAYTILSCDSFDEAFYIYNCL